MFKKTLLATAVLATSASVAAQTPSTESRFDPLTPELETFVVVASRTETPQRQLGSSVSVLDQADIKALGYPALADVLRTLPSVAVTNSGGMGKASSLRVRGEAGYRTLVRVDGVDVSDPTGTQAGTQIQHLLAANVGRVELLRGPQGMMYGADAGGVLDITTDSVRDGVRGGLDAEAGRYSTQALSGFVGAGDARGDVFVSAARVNSDGFNARLSDESGEADGYENTTVHARGSLNVNDAWRAQLVVRDTDAENEYDNCGWPDTTNDCIGFFSQRNARASVSHDHAQGQNTLAYSQTDVERTDYAAGVVDYDTEGKIAKWELNGNVHFSPSVAWVYGVEQRTDEVLAHSRDQWGAYLEYQGEYQSRLFVTAGVRYDDNDDFGDNTSYRLSAAYLIAQPGEGTVKLRSSVGTGFRAPSLFEIDYNRQQLAADPELALAELGPEESLGVELGIEYFTAAGLRLEAVAFEQRIEDEIYFVTLDFDTFAGGYRQGDQESRSRGVELIAQVPLTETLSLNTNYTWVDTEADDGNPRARQPEHLVNIGLRYTPVPRLGLSLNWRRAQARYERGNRLDDYQVLDASARYQLQDRLVVYVRGENILDEDYIEVPGFNTAGAAAYAGVELRF
ncbi:TonB-dependent receptor plug domain-containing protein [Marinimicrobium alkaliphilum]|uniref:TonB-dependent receptor plug domain-containing protein n=1 Tax=Marinimicrobium alkaliphilum TaxID=2202654 RepID=UPI000DBA095C|nr:TonB-dependent receptor [Marinimicrobium alkaliphilum]